MNIVILVGQSNMMHKNVLNKLNKTCFLIILKQNIIDMINTEV